MTQQHSDQINELVAALAKAMAVVENPARDREVTVTMDSGGKYKFKYATLSSIVDSIRKPLSENGLWFTHMMSPGEGANAYTLTTKLLHSSGQWIASEAPIYVSKQGNQQFGSALTYMKRYSLCALLGIVADEDDDGNAGDGHRADIGPTAKAARPATFTAPLQADPNPISVPPPNPKPSGAINAANTKNDLIEGAKDMKGIKQLEDAIFPPEQPETQQTRAALRQKYAGNVGLADRSIPQLRNLRNKLAEISEGKTTIEEALK